MTNTLLDASHGIGSKRATVDIDIAVFIENWDQFKRLKDKLIRTTDFSTTREIQRLLFRMRLPVDIVPFGGIAEKGDFIEWPPDRRFKMSVVGFRECYQHVVRIKISDKPEVVINFLANLTFDTMVMVVQLILIKKHQFSP